MAQRSAKRKVGALFMIFTAQFAGMGSSIFYFSSWDVVEAITWIVQSGWMFIGASYFLWQKSDMDDRIMFPHFNKIKYAQLIKNKDFDSEKEKFLNDLIYEIELYNTAMGVTKDQSPSNSVDS